MTDLATRIEAAEAGSRELSDEVLLALGWRIQDKQWGHMYRADGTICHCRERPNCTESVDDCLALVRESGLHYSMHSYEDCYAAEVGVTGNFEYVEAATQALALSAALVRAKATEAEHE